jgi:hypothetical protein
VRVSGREGLGRNEPDLRFDMTPNTTLILKTTICREPMGRIAMLIFFYRK